MWRSNVESGIRKGLSVLSHLARKTVVPEGTLLQVLLGPGRGLRYRVSVAAPLAAVVGGPERIIRFALAEMVGPGDVVYDLGANVGILTILLGRLVSPAGHVYAFEPFPSNVAELRFHVSLNTLDKVTTIVPKAVWNRTGQGSFVPGLDPRQGRLQRDAEGVAKAIQIETETLDHFVIETGHLAPNVVKIDVEGAEADVLEGGTQTFQRYRPWLIGEIHTPEQDLRVREFLRRQRYVAYRLGHQGAVPLEGQSPSVNIIGLFAAFPWELDLQRAAPRLLRIVTGQPPW